MENQDGGIREFVEHFDGSVSAEDNRRGILDVETTISGGKEWPKPSGAAPENLRAYKIYRWNPDDGKNPSTDTYYVDTTDCGPMVLDGLIWIKNNIDPTLTFRL